MSLEKSMRQTTLTVDTVDDQYCSEWLKEQIKRLFAQLADERRERDIARGLAKMNLSKLRIVTEALERCKSPTQHYEGCACWLCEALAKLKCEHVPDTNALGVGGTSVGWNHSGACLDGCNCDLARAAKRASEGDSHA
jgi:hypothetical protein